MRPRYKKSYLDEEPKIDLTPLIDVAFAIIIMMVVILPCLAIDKVKLASSEINNNVSKNENPLVIYVLKNNTFSFKDNIVSKEQLLAELKLAKQQHSNNNPLILQDKHSHFWAYQQVKDIVEQAGFTGMDVVLKSS